MKRMNYVFVTIALCSLPGCMHAYTQYEQQPPTPTITQIQGECFARFQKFIEQTDCIYSLVANVTSPPNIYAQQYMAYMQLMREKVKDKTLSENDARLKLVQKLNEVKSYQDNELAAQDQIENQRQMQTLEMLSRNKPYYLELPKARPLVLQSPSQTNCRMVGHEMQCTTY